MSDHPCPKPVPHAGHDWTPATGEPDVSCPGRPRPAPLTKAEAMENYYDALAVGWANALRRQSQEAHNGSVDRPELPKESPMDEHRTITNQKEASLAEREGFIVPAHSGEDYPLNVVRPSTKSWVLDGRICPRPEGHPEHDWTPFASEPSITCPGRPRPAPPTKAEVMDRFNDVLAMVWVDIIERRNQAGRSDPQEED